MNRLSELDFNKKPPSIAREVYKLVGEITGNNDPFKEIKKRDNREAMNSLSFAQKKISESKNSLLSAAKIAIAGNIMDFAAHSEYDIKNSIETVLENDFAIDDFSRFEKELPKAREISYLADNAGEIVFDSLLLKELERVKKLRINFFVKEKPIINDATREDAAFAGIDRIKNVKIMTTNTRSEPEFIKTIKESDIVISKGQGNYEALSLFDANIYFLLIAKCPVIARDLNVKVGGSIFKGNQK